MCEILKLENIIDSWQGSASRAMVAAGRNNVAVAFHAWKPQLIYLEKKSFTFKLEDFTMFVIVLEKQCVHEKMIRKQIFHHNCFSS